MDKSILTRLNRLEDKALGQDCVALVVLNEDGTWEAVYGIPQQRATFPTEAQATAHIRAHTAPKTLIVSIDV